MDQTFNKARYMELLKKEQRLNSQGSSLYDEDTIEDDELLSFGIILEGQIFYNRRHEYIALIERYVNHEIDSFFLRLQFFKMEREDLKITKDLKKNFEQLLNFSIDPKSVRFAQLRENIASACEVYDFDTEDDERKFRADIEKIFLEMKPYCEK